MSSAGISREGISTSADSVIAPSQPELLMDAPAASSSGGRELSIEARFEVWKVKPGAGKVMAMFYQWGAFYFKRWQERKVTVGIRLIEEQVRDMMRQGRADGVKENGYSLNSHFSRCIERHMVAEHPEWKVMFEERPGREEKTESGN